MGLKCWSFGDVVIISFMVGLECRSLGTWNVRGRTWNVPGTGGSGGS